MEIETSTKKLKDATSAELRLMNKARLDNWDDGFVDWKKEYPLNSEILFVKENKKVRAFLVFKPLRINYLKNQYNILGLCSGIALIKGKGYGKILMSEALSYLKQKLKSALGFTEENFFAKTGFGFEKDFIKRFVYVNPKTKEKIIDEVGDGVYYNGKDNFIKKVLETKSTVYIDFPYW